METTNSNLATGVATSRPISLGEKRIRTTITMDVESPGTLKHNAQEYAARAINCCDTAKFKIVNDEKITDEDKNECSRLTALAQTHFETAAMYAKKAATVGRPDLRDIPTDKA